MGTSLNSGIWISTTALVRCRSVLALSPRLAFGSVTVLQGANACTDALAGFRKLLRSKYQERDEENYQQAG